MVSRGPRVRLARFGSVRRGSLHDWPTAVDPLGRADVTCVRACVPIYPSSGPSYCRWCVDLVFSSRTRARFLHRCFHPGANRSRDLHVECVSRRRRLAATVARSCLFTRSPIRPATLIGILVGDDARGICAKCTTGDDSCRGSVGVEVSGQSSGGTYEHRALIVSNATNSF